MYMGILCLGLGGVALLLKVGDGSFDGVLGKHGTVQLHRGEVQVVGNLGVLDLGRLVDVHPFDPLRRHRAAGNR